MEPTKSMVEAAAIAIANLECGLSDGREIWERYAQSAKDKYTAKATACLRAAMVGVEVVFQPKREHPDITINAVVIVKDANWTSEYPPVPLNDGDTLAVFRGGV